ncbi:hypothetical protein ABZ896_10960 [Streptomyces sp. NPDC047072]|uniref:amidohydrolase family protein n=1 Tax=Streptomyces sp. NPDC047072 TaxID=3154809 RepID=UPI003403A0ED
MLTIHRAPLLLPGGGGEPLRDGAVLIEGQRITAVEVYEVLAAAHPTARVRRWPGVLTPGLVNPHGPELLEQTYHPDPREDVTEVHWGASARRGVQRMLAHGTVAVAGNLRRPAALDAVRRAGLRIVQRAVVGEPVFDLLKGRNLEDVRWEPLSPGVDATFTVFDAPDEPALAKIGASSCVATVIAGRLLYRAR